ncbi:phosphotransferase family protein [Rhodobacteraceae bacterium CCMM004]|nr:phosphotransferase family protein [Rhodobacteraceae bacterium CCMM004]
MVPGLDIPARTLADWLARHLPEAGPLIAVEKFGQGQSNPTYRLDCAGARLVLRAKPPGDLVTSAHQVEREFRAMAALARTPVPVPRVLALAPDAQSPLGRAFFVMEYLEGRIFWDPALPEVAQDARPALYDAMNAVLAALHEVDVDAVGLGDFGPRGAYFARQLDRWSRQVRAGGADRDPEMAALIAWLERAVPADDGQVALVHGDYRLDNMVFDAEVAAVRGLIDWELSTLGHPLADLAYQCMQWRLPHDAGMRGLGGRDRAALGLPDEEAYVAAYCRRRGLGGLDHWPFYLAFSFFRLAAILHGVVGRAAAGNASNPESARRYAQAIPVLVHLGRGIAAEAAA